MQISRDYDRCIFRPDVIEAAAQLILEMSGGTLRVGTCSVTTKEDIRTYPALDDWLVAYRRPNREALVHVLSDVGHFGLTVSARNEVRVVGSRVTVDAPTDREAERVLALFDDAREIALVPRPIEPEPEPEPVRIFIGHGRSQAYRDLKDHLADLHGYAVETFESGSRAGHTVRDILDSALRRSTIAFLVLTAEDEQSGGDFRARQNVVHEVGLFQGRLGWHRAIAIVENGVELFSNIDGVQQIRFGEGAIRETFGDVLAVLKREFENR